MSLCCGLRGNLSTDGKNGVQLIGFGRCSANSCNSKLAPPKSVKNLGSEFFDGTSRCGNPERTPTPEWQNGPRTSPYSPSQGTPGTSSVATIGYGRGDAQVGCCSGGPPARYSASKVYLFNMLR